MKRCMLILALCGGAAARGDIVIVDAQQYEFPPGSGRYIIDITYGLAPDQLIFSTFGPIPPSPELEIFDVPGMDVVDPPPFWNVSTRLQSTLGLPGLPDNPQLPNLVLSYNMTGAPMVQGPAIIGILHFETTGVPAVQGNQYFAARAFDQLTGAPVINGGSFVYVPAPGPAAILSAGLACMAIRRRRRT